MAMTSLAGTPSVLSVDTGERRRVAEIDRRFYAFAVDRVLAGVATIVATFLAVGLVLALLQGSTGRTPGKGLTGLRLVDIVTERPIGARRAVLRALVLGLAVVPFGFGLAALAWTSVADRSRLRRGWHDRLVSSIVVDVR